MRSGSRLATPSAPRTKRTAPSARSDPETKKAPREGRLWCSDEGNVRCLRAAREAHRDLHVTRLVAHGHRLGHAQGGLVETLARRAVGHNVAAFQLAAVSRALK